MSLSSTILGMAPKRYYRANETTGTLIDDTGSDNADLTTAGSPTLGSTQLVASDTAPAGSFSADGIDDTAHGTGSNVGGGAASTFPAFTIMCVAAVQVGAGLNTFWACEGAAASSSPILGFNVENAAGARLQAFYRNSASNSNTLLWTAGADIRDGVARLMLATVDPAGSGTNVFANGDIVLYVDTAGALTEVGRVAHVGTSATGTTFDQYALTNLWRNANANFAKVKIEHAASWARTLTAAERAAIYTAYTAAAGGGGPKSLAVGQVTETDLAQAIGRIKNKILGQALEGDATQAFTPRKLRAIGQPADVELAQAFALRKTKVLGQPATVNTAQAIAKKKMKALSFPVEVDAAQTLLRAHRRLLGQAIEVDSQQAVLLRKKIQAVGQALEDDSALHLGIEPIIFDQAAMTGHVVVKLRGFAERGDQGQISIASRGTARVIGVKR